MAADLPGLASVLAKLLCTLLPVLQVHTVLVLIVLLLCNLNTVFYLNSSFNDAAELDSAHSH